MSLRFYSIISQSELAKRPLKQVKLLSYRTLKWLDVVQHWQRTIFQHFTRCGVTVSRHSLIPVSSFTRRLVDARFLS